MPRAAVFLDRDGVINRGVDAEGRLFAPASVAELEILPGVADALLALRAAGYLLVVITNQPDVARGRTARADVDHIHAVLRQSLAIDDVRVCFHDDSDGCSCRKPQPGMIQDAARDFQIDLSRSFVVGDRWRDIEAGRRAGCRTLLVNSYQEGCLIDPDYEFPDLAAAAAWIVAEAPVPERQ